MSPPSAATAAALLSPELDGRLTRAERRDRLAGDGRRAARAAALSRLLRVREPAALVDRDRRAPARPYVDDFRDAAGARRRLRPRRVPAASCATRGSSARRRRRRGHGRVRARRGPGRRAGGPAGASRGLDDANLGGVFAGQVVEHLPPPALVRLPRARAREAARRRRARRRDDQPALAARAPPLLRRPHARAAARPADARAARRTPASSTSRRATSRRPSVRGRPTARLETILFARSTTRSSRADEDRRLLTAGARCARRRRGPRGAADGGAERSRPPGGARDRAVQVVPGARVLTHAFLWRMLDLEEVEGRKVDLLIATKFPTYVVRHPNKRRLARAPVPPGVRPRPDRARRVRRERASAARRAASSTAARSARPSACSRSRATSQTACDARSGSRPRSCSAAAGARLPLRGVRRLRALRRPARPGEARRPPARGGR